MTSEKDEESDSRPTRKDLIDHLERMIDTIQGLPPIAMMSYINHYDYCSLLILLHSIFSMEDKPQS